LKETDIGCGTETSQPGSFDQITVQQGERRAETAERDHPDAQQGPG
jgi:hypothetical protein